MQEVLDLVVDNANGRSNVQPFRSPMIKAPRYRGSDKQDSGLKPQETPSQSDSSQLLGGGQQRTFLQDSNKAYEPVRRESELFNDTMPGGQQFETPEDLKKQNSTPVRRGRQPEMSGQLGASLMSLKNQANLWNCTSVGAFANQPTQQKTK